jgi:uncharacterized Tic20 family protein
MDMALSMKSAQHSTPPSVQEKNLAALAHGSVLLTFLVAVVSGGLGSVVTVLVPLFMWLWYRDRSPYVAFHALQATLFQVAGLATIFVASVVLGTFLALAWVVTGLLSLVLVGLVLIPIAIILSVLVGGILLALPLVSLGYGLLAAWEVYNGNPFYYRWLGPWLEERHQLTSTSQVV